MTAAPERRRADIGVLAVVLTLIAVFAAFRFALYIPETIYLITVPHSEITVTLA